VKTLNAKKLEKKTRAQAWSFIRAADVSLKSGVGETSQLAIAKALTLALRGISGNFNAVEVLNIHLTQYPWFFLARVSISSCRIQQNAMPPMVNGSEPLPVAHRQRTPRRRSAALSPYFAAAMPQLKQILTSSQRRETRAI
jgi:hypothetical protein